LRDSLSASKLTPLYTAIAPPSLSSVVIHVPRMQKNVCFPKQVYCFLLLSMTLHVNLLSYLCIMLAGQTYTSLHLLSFSMLSTWNVANQTSFLVN